MIPLDFRKISLAERVLLTRKFMKSASLPRRPRFLTVLTTLVAWSLLGSLAWGQIDPRAAKPPVAKKTPKTMQIHGDTRVDNYFWLREKSNPEVIGYLNAENAYAEAVTKRTEPFQEALYKEMVARIKETDLDVPHRIGEWWYYSKTEKGKQYPIHCRKHGSLDATEQVTLDLNEMAKGHKFLGLGIYSVNDNGQLLAYSVDTTGFREYTLYVKDLGNGMTLPDRIPKVQSAAWSADGQTLFYVVEDAAKRPSRLFRHVLGNSQDELVYEEKDELFRLLVRRSHDKEMVFAQSQSSDTGETRFLQAGLPRSAWQVVLPRQTGHEYSVDHRGGLFYIRTNKDAKNFRLVTAPVPDPQPANWKEIVPHRKDVLLESVDLFAKHCVVGERQNGLPTRRIINLDDNSVRSLEFPDPTYSLADEHNEEFNTSLYRYRYESLVTPRSIYDYDMNTGESKLLKRTEVLGGFDPARYTSERLFATASDGTRIPISLVYRKDVKLDGSAAMLLIGYGSYGLSLPVNFASPRLSLIDRGVIFAIAHIRGGSEMGRHWYEDGKLMHKRNTFTDFIAAADFLIDKKYASRDRLVIQGGSAGGLLIGAVLNLRPDLCRAAVLEVPFVDVINTMLDASLPLTIQEYLEWGNPNVKAEYDYIKTYCPYTNLAAKDYPAIVVMTSLNDSQVMYWEPAKYVAKLRSLKTDQKPLLFKCRMAGGHGGASGRYDALRDVAFIAAFVLNEMGLRN
jgi:oligopeptidase B